MKINKEIAIGILHSALTESSDYQELESGEIQETDLISVQITPDQIASIIGFLESLPDAPLVPEKPNFQPEKGE